MLLTRKLLFFVITRPSFPYSWFVTKFIRRVRRRMSWVHYRFCCVICFFQSFAFFAVLVIIVRCFVFCLYFLSLFDLRLLITILIYLQTFTRLNSNCSFGWYWWICWPSLFKRSVPFLPFSTASFLGIVDSSILGIYKFWRFWLSWCSSNLAKLKTRDQFIFSLPWSK